VPIPTVAPEPFPEAATSPVVESSTVSQVTAEAERDQGMATRDAADAAPATEAAGSPDVEQLAHTGGSAGLAVLGAGLVAGGAGIVAVGRKREDDESEGVADEDDPAT
jgi:LPXTG-motif cell wall-anchored protein